MRTFTIKVTGTPDDVQTGTRLIEQIYGVENIHRMSGINTCSRNSLHRFRYIELLSDKIIIDNNGNPVRRFFQNLKKA